MFDKSKFLFLLPLTAISSFAYANDYFNNEQAQKALFPDADIFIPSNINFTKEQKKKIEDISKVRQRSNEQKMWKAEKKGKHIGWFIVDEVVGKHEFITYGTAISPEGKVMGLEIMSYRETHGSQVRNQEWRKKFIGKTIIDPFKLDIDIPNISGATLSCRNVVDGVKRLLAIYKVAIEQ